MKRITDQLRPLASIVSELAPEYWTAREIRFALDVAEAVRSEALEYQEAENKKLRLSLRNVLRLARTLKRTKNLNRTSADHLIRFCAEAGVTPSILRVEDQSTGSETPEP